MRTLAAHIMLASAAAFVFLLCNRTLQSKICARGRYFIGCLLIVSFILPIKIPLFRVEIPKAALDALGYYSEAAEELSPSYVFDTTTGEAQFAPSDGGQTSASSAKGEDERVFSAGSILFALYIIGVFLSFFCIFYRYCRAVKILQRCGRAPKEEEAREYGELCKKFRVKSTPRLLICPSYAVGSSLTFGFFRKTIVISDKISKEDAPSIIGHELTHCKRNDTTAKAFLAILFSLYWFDPIIYIFIRAMGNLLEQACDEEFLSGGDIEARKRYCRLLVSTASVNKSFIFNTFKGGKFQMKKRIDNILTTKSKKITALVIFTVLALTLISSVVYAVVVPASNNATEEANVLSEQDIKDQFLGWEELNLYGYNDEEKEELADRYFNTSTPYGLSQGQIHELSDQTWKYNGQTILLIQHNGENWKVQSDARPALAANGIGVDIVDMPDGTVEIRVLSDEELVNELFSTAFVFETIYMENAYNEYLESEEYKYLLETRPYSEHYGNYTGPFLTLERFTNEDGTYDYQKFYETRHLYNEKWHEGKLDLEGDYWQTTQLFWKTLFARIGVTVE